MIRFALLGNLAFFSNLPLGGNKPPAA